MTAQQALIVTLAIAIWACVVYLLRPKSRYALVPIDPTILQAAIDDALKRKRPVTIVIRWSPHMRIMIDTVTDDRIE